MCRSRRPTLKYHKLLAPFLLKKLQQRAAAHASIGPSVSGVRITASNVCACDRWSLVTSKLKWAGVRLEQFSSWYSTSNSAMIDHHNTTTRDSVQSEHMYVTPASVKVNHSAGRRPVVNHRMNVL